MPQVVVTFLGLGSILICVFKSIAIVRDLNDVAMMGASVKQCRGHLGGAERVGRAGSARNYVG
jgi:hypothetical protein